MLYGLSCLLVCCKGLCYVGYIDDDKKYEVTKKANTIQVKNGYLCLIFKNYIMNMTNKEFARVIERLQNKDIGALKILYGQFFKRIYYTAFGVVKSEHDAYDIAMNVIMKLIEYPSDPYRITNHIGLLITMTKNEAKDFLREGDGYVNVEDMEEIAVTDLKDQMWLYDILNELSDDEQDLFIAHCIWDKKLKDLALESGKSYITVKRAYAEIKRKIKQIYS